MDNMKQQLYRLLMVEHRDKLEACYRRVFGTNAPVRVVKTLDDCLSDFYLYLLTAKPKSVQEATEGYYLQQVKDPDALPGWLYSTFHHFLLDEHKVLVRMQEAIDEYRLAVASARSGESTEITLTHVAFAIAWFNQHESAVNRYLLFRSAYKHFSGFYVWPDHELSDAEVATLLGMSPGALRTRTSRQNEELKRLVTVVNNALISSLDNRSLMVARSICVDPDPDIADVLEQLMGQAESELPQYDEILALRASRRQPVDLCLGLLPDEEAERSILHDVVPHAGLMACMSTLPPEQVLASRIVRQFKAFVGM